MIAIDLSKQQALDADPRAIQQFNFTANLERAAGNTRIYFNSEDETNRQVANLRKAFANHTSTDIKLSKTQLSKMIQSGGCLGKNFRSITKNRIAIN